MLQQIMAGGEGHQRFAVVVNKVSDKEKDMLRSLVSGIGSNMGCVYGSWDTQLWNWESTTFLVGRAHLSKPKAAGLWFSPSQYAVHSLALSTLPRGWLLWQFWTSFGLLNKLTLFLSQGLGTPYSSSSPESSDGFLFSWLTPSYYAGLDLNVTSPAHANWLSSSLITFYDTTQSDFFHGICDILYLLVLQFYFKKDTFLSSVSSHLQVAWGWGSRLRVFFGFLWPQSFEQCLSSK